MRSAEELEKALISIRQARDMVIARNLEISSELAQTRDLVTELEGEREASAHDRDAALQLAQDLSRQNDELRERANSRAEENANLPARWHDAEEAARERQSAAPEASASAPAPSDDLRQTRASIH